MTSGDPGSIRANALQLGLNIRSFDGEWRVRPGHTRIGDTLAGAEDVMQGADLWGWDADPLRLFFSLDACFGASLSGATAFLFQSEQYPRVQAFAEYFSPTNTDVALGVFSGRLYVGEWSNLRLVAPVTAGGGVQARELSSTPPETIIESFSGYKITCLQEFDGKLFIGLTDAGAGNNKVVSYDGLEIKNDLTAIEAPIRFCLWRNHLVLAHAPAAGKIRIRDAGSVPGTWASVTSAGLGGIRAPCMVSFRDKVYVADGATKIFSYDGSAVATARTIATAGGSSGGIVALAVFNDMLYYLWNVSATPAIIVGKYDATGSAIEWIDTEKNLTGQFSNIKLAKAMFTYRGSLCVLPSGLAAVVGLNPETAALQFPFMYSGPVTSGPWEGVNPATALSTTQGAIGEVVVF